MSHEQYSFKFSGNLAKCFLVGRSVEFVYLIVLVYAEEPECEVSKQLCNSSVPLGRQYGNLVSDV